MCQSAIAVQQPSVQPIARPTTSSAPKYLTDLGTPGAIRGLDYNFNDGTLWLNSSSGQTLRLDAVGGVISVKIFDGPLNISHI